MFAEFDIMEVHRQCKEGGGCTAYGRGMCGGGLYWFVAEMDKNSNLYYRHPIELLRIQVLLPVSVCYCPSDLPTDTTIGIFAPGK